MLLSLAASCRCVSGQQEALNISAAVTLVTATHNHVLIQHLQTDRGSALLSKVMIELETVTSTGQSGKTVDLM